MPFLGGCAKPELTELEALLVETKRKARQGCPVAQYDLGMHYAKDECCSPVPALDPKEGAKWFRRAARQGHVAAKLELAELYFRGSGVPKNTQEGIKWLHKAAELDADAQYLLANYYLWGYYVPKDEEKGRELYRQAAERGHAEAAYQLGLCYFHGRGGVSKDREEAAKWFQKSGLGEPEEWTFPPPRNSRSEEWYSETIQKAEQGDAEAMLLLYHYYSEREPTGDKHMPMVGIGPILDDMGPPRDKEEGLKWLRQAAELGHAESQYNLGNRYNGVYIGGGPRNDAEMEKWLRKSAEQGFAMAQFQLGQFYFRDFFDSLRDSERKLYEGGREVSTEEIEAAMVEAKANVSEENWAEGLKWLRLANASGKRSTMYHANQLLRLIGEE